jgi:Tol biopolymer transport system component
LSRNDDGLWILPDGLTAYYSSDRPDVPDGGVAYHVFSATRPDSTSPFGASIPELAVDDGGVARTPVVSPDGKTLYFFRGAGGPGEVLTSTRASLSQPFGIPTEAGAPFTTGSTNVVTWISADGRSILFASNRVGKIDVYRTELVDGAFDTPAAVASLNSVANDYAILTPDELQAFVASDRAGDSGLDLYYTRRASTSDPFPPPAPLVGANLNTPQLENVAWVSADGCTLYFKRSTSPYGIYKLFVTVRPK